MEDIVQRSDQPVQWDPRQYARYTDERSRPFFDLVGQIEAESPARVVDLGCGPGSQTLTLADRWPAAEIHGIDSSPEMIERTRPAGNVTFALGDVNDFSASGLDVVLSNALLQWVPAHRQLLQRWAGELNPGGWLAFQVPANFDSPSHQLMREVAGSPRWRGRVGNVLRHDDAVAEPREYLDLLNESGLSATVWQTEYLHVLPGADPVLQWVRGTGLRPILAVLSGDEQAEFEREYSAALRQAYPPRPYGTVLPFRRTFAVARKPGGRS